MGRIIWSVLVALPSIIEGGITNNSLWIDNSDYDRKKVNSTEPQFFSFFKGRTTCGGCYIKSYINISSHSTNLEVEFPSWL